MKTSVDLRGALVLDEMQPQFAATIAANSDGYFPVAGESAFWLEVRPGIQFRWSDAKVQGGLTFSSFERKCS